MSNNNQVIISKWDGKFGVFENLCVDNEDFEPSKDSFLKSFETLIEAIKYAQKYCQEYPYVEYNYIIYDSALEEK